MPHSPTNCSTVNIAYPLNPSTVKPALHRASIYHHQQSSTNPLPIPQGNDTLSPCANHPCLPNHTTSSTSPATTAANNSIDAHKTQRFRLRFFDCRTSHESLVMCQPRVEGGRGERFCEEKWEEGIRVLQIRARGGCGFLEVDGDGEAFPEERVLDDDHDVVAATPRIASERSSGKGWRGLWASAGGCFAV